MSAQRRLAQGRGKNPPSLRALAPVKKAGRKKLGAKKFGQPGPVGLRHVGTRGAAQPPLVAKVLPVRDESKFSEQSRKVISAQGIVISAQGISAQREVLGRDGLSADPPAFLVTLLVAVVLTPFTSFGIYLLAGLLGLYLAANFAAAALTARTSGWMGLPGLMLRFGFQHVGYASGSLLGLVHGGNRRLEASELDY